MCLTASSLDPKQANVYFAFSTTVPRLRTLRSSGDSLIKVVALLKLGKDPSVAKSFGLISLLCHIYKLFERLILYRIEDHVDAKLIPEQAGFRPGKSCTSQLLNLTEHSKTATRSA